MVEMDEDEADQGHSQHGHAARMGEFDMLTPPTSLEPSKEVTSLVGDVEEEDVEALAPVAFMGPCGEAIQLDEELEDLATSNWLEPGMGVISLDEDDVPVLSDLIEIRSHSSSEPCSVKNGADAVPLEVIPPDDESDSLTLISSTEFSNTDPPKRGTSCVVQIPESTLLTPKSCYEPFEPGAPLVAEVKAVNALKRIGKCSGSAKDDDYIELQLDDFAVYIDQQQFPEEMRSLHQLDTKTGHGKLFFDGRLSVDDTAFFVRRVPIAALPIDNYGILTEHTVRGKIWIESELNKNRGVYYRLGEPAQEYRRFFHPFLWVADLAKHFVDFIQAMGKFKRNVAILDFQTTFSTWLNKAHKKAPVFLAWRAQHPSNDFRTSVVANLGFLHKEAVGVLGYKTTYKHVLWSEVLDFTRYKRLKSASEAESPPTVVTRYIYDCFVGLPFGDRLEAVSLGRETNRMRNQLIQQRRLELPSAFRDGAKSIPITSGQQISLIKPGDTISTRRDSAGSGTQWRRDVSHSCDDVDRWLALVQKVRVDRQGRRSFDVIWYYRPVDTLCGVMRYPWNNELFLSDHCSCEESAKIREGEVLGVHEVEFGGDSRTSAEFFCRQTYMTEERRWVTLEKHQLECGHHQTKERQRALPDYEPGDTLLVVLDRSTGRSEPCEFIMSYKESGSDIFRFRRLPRRNEVDSTTGKKTARPNELVYSEQLIEVRRSRIREPCHVRWFPAGSAIPTPYDFDGVGRFFYLTHEEVMMCQDEDGDGRAGETRLLRPLESAPATLRQAYDPIAAEDDDSLPRLRGLDLFCGGGNFGRGLEDGGGIQMRWANDYDAKALHTYMANTAGPEAVTPFLGSIDDLQRMAMQGGSQGSIKAPAVGDIDFISGGSPCPGFSRLTNDTTTVPQRKNQSLVAAFGSFVDLYRPQYALLENVPGIVATKANRSQDVLGQLVCALVGLGYQLQVFLLDASAYGAPQRRGRVFLTVAAPGLRMPRRPEPTHAHPPGTKSLRLGSGNLSTGAAITARVAPADAPFGFVSAQAATADLPPIGDAKVDACVPFPDHRVSLGQTRQLRAKISRIPTRPYGMNFATAWYGLDRKTAGSGVLSAADRLVFPADNHLHKVHRAPSTVLGRTAPYSNAYGRQWPDRLVETIVTSQSPSDAKSGRRLHWREDRVLTIMEARRAQGFCDADVLLGLPADQYRIVGNSVARQVAVTLGISFREAWVRSLADREGRLLRQAEAVPLDAAVPDGRPLPAVPSPASMDEEAVAVDDEAASSGGYDYEEEDPNPSEYELDEEEEEQDDDQDFSDDDPKPVQRQVRFHTNFYNIFPHTFPHASAPTIADLTPDPTPTPPLHPHDHPIFAANAGFLTKIAKRPRESSLSVEMPAPKAAKHQHVEHPSPPGCAIQPCAVPVPNTAGTDDEGLQNGVSAPAPGQGFTARFGER